MIAWLFVRQGWPGSALYAVLRPHPVLSWMAVSLFAMVPGGIGFPLLARWWQRRHRSA